MSPPIKKRPGPKPAASQTVAQQRTEYRPEFGLSGTPVFRDMDAELPNGQSLRRGQKCAHHGCHERCMPGDLITQFCAGRKWEHAFHHFPKLVNWSVCKSPCKSLGAILACSRLGCPVSAPSGREAGEEEA
jgi:hypothetical protein